jgi:S-DNA-T family DNA segregation ATPase FtsK/SpoIIIE
VDPKVIELKMYADMPHLVHPIVTDMTLVKNAMNWAVREMEDRYELLSRLNARNILSYNQKLAALEASSPPEFAALRHLPYLVLIIDEFGDIMSTPSASKEVEASVVRLAQKARAAGIHLIIATQRPDGDVFTGLIKANFPCRVSFQVSSAVNSRIILDANGAERLLGKGDMLYKPGGDRLRRLHGAFVRDEEVQAVVDYWRSRQKPDYQVDFVETGSNAAEPAENGGLSGEEERYAQAVEFTRRQGKVSISLIQRQFRIGFNGAVRIVEQMEKDGIIGPADGSKPRIVR